MDFLDSCPSAEEGSQTNLMPLGWLEGATAPSQKYIYWLSCHDMNNSFKMNRQQKKVLH
jgi:hypothetical protein